MNSTDGFDPIRVERRTRETVFAISLGPRRDAGNLVRLPNQLLGHFLDHFLKACGLSLEIADMSWPGSWKFDHVLCEDVGQLVAESYPELYLFSSDYPHAEGGRDPIGRFDRSTATLSDADRSLFFAKNFSDIYPPL